MNFKIKLSKKKLDTQIALMSNFFDLKSITNTLFKEITVKSTFYCLMSISFLWFFITLFITNGYTLKYFVFWDNSDMFMDFFNSIRDAKDNLVFQRGVIYPPFSTGFFYILSRFIPSEYLKDEFALRHLSRDNQFGLMIYIIFLMITVIALLSLFYKFKKGRESERIIFSIMILLSFPFIWTYERGNIIIVAMACTLFFAFTYDCKNRIISEIGLICLAIAVSLKLYPVFFGLILLKDKKYKESVRACIYGVLFLLIPFIFYGGFPTIVQFYNNVTKFSNRNIGIIYANKTDFGTFITMILKIFDMEIIKSLQIGMLVSRVIELIGIIMFFFIRKQWKSWMMLFCLTANIPNVSGSYNLIFAVIPLIMFLDDSEKGLKDYLYMFIFFAMFATIPFGLQGTERTYGISTLLGSPMVSCSFLLLIIEAFLNIYKFVRKKIETKKILNAEI